VLVFIETKTLGIVLMQFNIKLCLTVHHRYK